MHSAKFTNEQQSVNVLHAIEKYAIDHCVVNDTDSTMWNDLAVCCWPTLILIGNKFMNYNVNTYIYNLW